MCRVGMVGWLKNGTDDDDDRRIGCFGFQVNRYDACIAGRLRLMELFVGKRLAKSFTCNQIDRWSVNGV